MDRKLYDAIIRVREEMNKPGAWDELIEKWDKRNEELEKEQRMQRMSFEDMNRPFDL